MTVSRDVDTQVGTASVYFERRSDCSANLRQMIKDGLKRLAGCGLEIGPGRVSLARVRNAIAAFERTALSGNSPFDRWFYGKDEKAVSASVKRGFEVFRAQGTDESGRKTSGFHLGEWRRLSP